MVFLSVTRTCVPLSNNVYLSFTFPIGITRVFGSPKLGSPNLSRSDVFLL